MTHRFQPVDCKRVSQLFFKQGSFPQLYTYTIANMAPRLCIFCMCPITGKLSPLASHSAFWSPVKAPFWPVFLDQFPDLGLGELSDFLILLMIKTA